MALTLVQPLDLIGLDLGILGKKTGIDMTTAAVYNIWNQGPSMSAMVTHYVLSNFSAFPSGLLPATWAWTAGIAPTASAAPAAPTNFQPSANINGSAVTYILAQGMANTSPYVPNQFTFYFAVATTTNGVGTFDLTVIGGILQK